MTDALPPASGDPDVLLAAIAKAAARLAAQDVGRRTDPPDEDAVEEIAKRCVREAFKEVGIDLTSIASIEEFRTTWAYARKSRAWWDKAAGAIATAIMSSVGLGVMAAVGKYVLGGAK